MLLTSVKLMDNKSRCESNEHVMTKYHGVDMQEIKYKRTCTHMVMIPNLTLSAPTTVSQHDLDECEVTISKSDPGTNE